MAKKTKNTEKEPHIDWLFGMNPRAIENQEAEGQRELVESQQLPRICNHPRGVNAAEQYHKMGIKVFTSSKGDDLFVGVKLPDGWRKEATDHSMWNNLIDDKGNVRAMFFYKAAFYDRDAFVDFKCRYEQTCKYYDDGYTCCVIDGHTGRVLFESDKLDSKNIGPDYFHNQELYIQQCKSFLDSNYPNHQDINAYWS